MSDKTPSVEERLSALEQANEDLRGSHAALQEENAALKKMLAKPVSKEKEKPVLPTQTFKVDGKEYKFRLAAFKVKDATTLQFVSVTAVDALSDEKLLAELVKRQSGAIVPVL